MPRSPLTSRTRREYTRLALAQAKQALQRTRKQAAAAQQRFDSLFAHNPDAVYALDLQGRIIAANAACETQSGYSLAELLGSSALTFIDSEDVARVSETFLKVIAGEATEHEMSFVRKSGRKIDVQAMNLPIVVEGVVIGMYSVVRDISLRRRLLDLTRPISATSSVEGQVNLILTALADVLPYSSGGLYWIDHIRRVLRPTTVVSTAWISAGLDVFEVPLDSSVLGSIAEANQGELVNHAELDPRSVYPEGASVPCEHLIAVPVAVDGRTVGVFYVSRHVDPPFSPREFEVVQLFIGHAAAAIEKMHLFEQTRASEERFQHQALHDSLTDLPNRVLLHDRLGHAIASARRTTRNQGVALLVLDLDRFKAVNDTLGHHAGDRLLQEVGRRLRGSLRDSDTVARLGGDEFAAVLPGADAASAAIAAAKLQAALDVPLVLDGHVLSLAASIGIAAFPAHGDDADSLLRRADMAMYSAKRSQSGVATYTPDYDSQSSERLALVVAMRRAIALEELSLHYQPQVDCATGRMTGVEALVRWWHPERGLIHADQFVPLAEQSGLIGQLTRWVLRAAICQAAAWRKLGPNGTMSVNLSSFDLLDDQLPGVVAAELERWQLPGELLTLEITESALLNEPDRAVDVLIELRKLGVRIALDDFGTGLSPLAHLKVWPLDELKADLSLVRNMLATEADRAILRATIELAHAVGLIVIAEGVEDASSLRALQALGCDRAQGYYLASPMPPSLLARWYQTRLEVLAANLRAAA